MAELQLAKLLRGAFGREWVSKPAARQLPRLPCLTADASVWYLPLNGHAAHELARLLVLDELSERENLAAQLMSVDPAVTLWAACALALRDDVPEAVVPRCVMDLAGWLARHAGRALIWSAADVEASLSAPEHPSRWRELAADAVAVANLAADSIADDDVAAETFLLGLLHNAADWLRSCGPRVSIPKQQQGCLPSWLVTRLRERSRAPRSEAMQHVMQAARLWRESGRRRRRVADVDVTDALWARRRWQVTGWQVMGRAAESNCHVLVALTEKLQRLERLERDFQRTLEQEKLASLGELAYGASHEINNPLANISTRAQALLAGESDPERRRMLAIINTQAFRANEMIADMMLFARPPELVRHDVDLVTLVDSLLDELAEEARLQGTRLARCGDDDRLVISADATQLAMALRAVVLNALQALGAEGEVEIALQRTSCGGDGMGQWARVDIRDTGPGIPPHVRRHLFDPFFSGREAGRGLGFGLAKCWRVVSLHDGRIEVGSTPRQGTTISISLPMPVACDEPETGSESVPASERAGERE